MGASRGRDLPSKGPALMIKYAALLTLALVLSISGALGLSRDAGTATSPATVDAPGTNATGAQAVAALEEQVRRVPGDHRAWADLGLAYFEEAGITFDQDLYAKADAAVDRSLQIQPQGNVAALATGAAISASHHDFVAALDQADAALAIAPYDPIALGIRVDALTQLGKFGQQLVAVRTADRRQPGVGTTSRYSYAVELRGDLDRARTMLMSATDTTNRTDLAHLLSHAADLDRRQGRLNAAQDKLDRALQAVPGDTDALTGLALLDTARGDLDAAVVRWRDIVDMTPLPEHYIELAETLDALGRDEEAQQAYDDSIAAVRVLEAGGANIDLELALFLADHGSADEALPLAEAEWARSKGIHAADGMAWVLHANDRDREALRYARLATRLDTQEPSLWAHRGIIESALGMTHTARTHLQRSLAMDPGESPWQRAQADSALRALPARR
jgi:tetratricopeptide (TPR) repeat protein